MFWFRHSVLPDTFKALTMHFDFTDLRLCLNILDAGNITAGATASHLSLAAASARVRALEASLGTALFERGRRGVTPTAAGKALAQHARTILQQAERMQQDLAEYAQGFKGQIRLLCNTAALTEYLPELLADFLNEQPNISLDLQEMTSQRIADALRQGAADLGIVSDAVDTSDLHTRAFRDDPLVLVMPVDHPLANLEYLSFNDTLSHAYVALDANSALAVYLEAQALQAGWRMQVRVRAQGFDGVVRMVARGAGLGIVPKATLARWPDDPHLIWRELPEPWARRTLRVCARSFDGLPGYTRALLEHLSPA